MIKKLLTIAAVASAGLLAAPKAEAGHSSRSEYTYRSGVSSCGCPIYTTRFTRGYDNYRRPIFGYAQARFSHGSSCRHRAGSHYPQSFGRSPVYRQSGRSIHGSHLSISNRGIRIGFSTGGYQRGYSRRYSQNRGCR